MKKLIATFLFIISANSLSSQTVISSCQASDSVKKLYLADADRLTLRKIYSQNLIYKDSIVIPQSHTDTILKALIAVYNATALPARNTVISLYNIHTFPNPNLNGLYVAADSNLAWMHQLKLGNIPTGNSVVDGLINKYHLNVQNYSNFFGLNPYHVITLSSDSSLNLPPLSDTCNTIPGVYFSGPNSTIGDGNEITATVTPNYVQLDYSIGWGDCPAGCIYRHYWSFKVYYNCSVEFMGESGVALPAVAAPTINVTGSKCTNQTLTVTISSANSYSLNGQLGTTLQFTLSSSTPTSYIISALSQNYPALASASLALSIVDCNTLTTTLEKTKEYFAILIYPNPANEFITIDASKNHQPADSQVIRIYNSLGQLVKVEKRIATLTIINTGELSEGVYFLKLMTDSEASITKRFVVAR